LFVHLTQKSSNSKTGGIPVSTTSAETCPQSCPFINNGCYAKNHLLGHHWKQVNKKERGTNFTEFLQKVRNLPDGQLWRHNQAGDLPGHNEQINKRKLERLVKASKGKRGFTYSHKKIEGNDRTAKRNRAAIRESNNSDFVINLSANGIEHADRLVKLGVAPVTTVISSTETRRTFKTPDGNTCTVCPAQVEDNITCQSCQLCAIPNRKSIVTFRSHGTKLKQVNDTVASYSLQSL